jgi:hypothetical protein
MLFLNRNSQNASLASASMTGTSTWSDIARPGGVLTDPVAGVTTRLCGSMECTATRVSPWRNRRRPIFEEQWGCSGRCVLSMVRAAVRREIGDGLETTTSRHLHRLPLGLLMLAQGWISQDQLQAALTIQREMGGRIGDWLVAECGVEQEQVTRALSLQWSCPVLTARAFMPGVMALVAPRPFIEEFGFLPLRVAGSKLLYLGFEERLDASVALALEQMTDLKVESGLVATEEYGSARASLLQQLTMPLTAESVAEPEALASRITALLEQRQPIAARLVRVHRYLWLRLWLEKSSRSSRGARPRDTEDMHDYIFTLGR